MITYEMKKSRYPIKKTLLLDFAIPLLLVLGLAYYLDHLFAKPILQYLVNFPYLGMRLYHSPFLEWYIHYRFFGFLGLLLFFACGISYRTARIPGPGRAFRRFWDHHLSQWDRVVKIGANLGGPARNSIVIRNWPTMSFDEPIAPEPRTALYSGNLGYGHDVELLVEACGKLRTQGYRVSMRSDGRGAWQLPAWLQPLPLENNPLKLREDLLRHEVHLVAANPKITQALFPSKIWNSLAAGRRLVCTGFAGEMAVELETSKSAPFQRHLEQWTNLISTTRNCDQPGRIAPLEPALA